MLMRTVLCPLDFSDLSFRALELGAGLCQSSGAKLVIHHNFGESGVGSGMRWMHLQEQHGITSEEAIEARLREIQAALPEELRTEVVITRGPAARAILAVQGPAEADLVLLGTHGPSSEDHSSVTEGVLDGSPCPVLVLHDSMLERAIPGLPSLPEARPWTVLVPTDLTPESLACVRYAFELATIWPVELHLLHVASDGLTGAREETLRKRLLALVPPELEGAAQCHVRVGDPTTRIVSVAEDLGADAIVMGAHTRSPLRRFLTRDTARELLHRTERPVWMVPSGWTM